MKLRKNRPIPLYYFAGYTKKWDISKDIEYFSSSANYVINQKLTLLNYDRLYTIFQALRQIKDGDVILECGVYRGGTSLFISKILSNCKFELYAVDTFTGHKDSDSNYDGDFHQNDLQFTDIKFEEVKKMFYDDNRVNVICKRIQDFTPTFEMERLRFIHLDTDLYHPTKFVLDMYAPKIKTGSVIIVDDYGKFTTPGVSKAVDEFFEKNPEQYFFIHLISGQALLVKL